MAGILELATDRRSLTGRGEPSRLGRQHRCYCSQRDQYPSDLEFVGGVAWWTMLAQSLARLAEAPPTPTCLRTREVEPQRTMAEFAGQWLCCWATDLCLPGRGASTGSLSDISTSVGRHAFGANRPNGS